MAGRPLLRWSLIRHHAQVLAAAAAGKHVLCEKPLALTLDECAEMTVACARAASPGRARCWT